MGAPDGIKLTPLVTMSRANPYPALEMLRWKGPVVYSPTVGTFLVTGLAEAQEVFKNPHMSRAALWEGMFVGRPRNQDIGALFRSSALFSDPPDHSRIRAFVSRTFQPRVIENLRSHTENMVDNLLDAIGDRTSVDIVDALARPLPVEVIAKLIGVPREDWDQCIEWSEALAPLIDAAISDEVLIRAVDAGLEFADYIRELVDRRRTTPTDDIMTTLVRGLVETETLSEDELIANVITLFAAGHETTSNLIGNTFVLLSNHEDQRQRFEADPGAQLEGMIEEVLRYEPAVQLASRVALEDTVIGDTHIPAGQYVWVLIGGANRDPAHFENPQSFDISRSPNPHVSFGSGIHFCMGSALSRLEAQVTFERFFARFPRWRLAEQDLELRPTTTLRGYLHIEVELE